MSDFYLDTEAFSDADRALLEGALAGAAEGDGPFSLELLLVDEEEIRRLNREQRGIDRVTDVLSFPSLEGIRGEFLSSDEYGDELDEAGRLFLGSVVICTKRAEEQAEEYGHGMRRELFYLTVHGVMHCLGYDHETEADKAQMRAKEEEVLRKMGLERE